MAESPYEYLVAMQNAPEVNKRMCAALSCLVYKSAMPSTLPPGWMQIAQAPQDDGYDAFAWRHEPSKTIVFLNRGTEGFKSWEDWFEGAAAAFFAKFKGPLAASVEFFKDTMIGVSDDFSEVLAVGHSFGGALAEAQVALGNQALDAAGYERIPLSGMGIGSAGFARAIRQLAADRGWALDSQKDFAWKMNHYVRRCDPILLQPWHEFLGLWEPEPSIYAPMKQPARRGQLSIWTLMPPALLNHSQTHYFEFFDLDADKHLYRNRDGAFVVFAGDEPERTRFGTVHPDEVLGVG